MFKTIMKAARKGDTLYTEVDGKATNESLHDQLLQVDDKELRKAVHDQAKKDGVTGDALKLLK